MSTITEQFTPMPLDDLVSKIGHFPTASLSEKHSLISDLVKVHPLLSLDFSKGSVFGRARKIGETQYPSSVQICFGRLEVFLLLGELIPKVFPSCIWPIGQKRRLAKFMSMMKLYCSRSLGFEKVPSAGLLQSVSF